MTDPEVHISKEFSPVHLSAMTLSVYIQLFVYNFSLHLLPTCQILQCPSITHNFTDHMKNSTLITTSINMVIKYSLPNHTYDRRQSITRFDMNRKSPIYFKLMIRECYSNVGWVCPHITQRVEVESEAFA